MSFLNYSFFYSFFISEQDNIIKIYHELLQDIEQIIHLYANQLHE
ncbi:hypothetical protein LDG_6712 [Legionella drancourtii LLAP12]|uniref:Uncharacterized protein n=1 Tax=Legionella drancourtii LLAP12 TaxID=658187 RepID=G9EN90_9GAMM|nr:hypothetical protein LDG_6712 [Legionella drancourtii LLAP12]